MSYDVGLKIDTGGADPAEIGESLNYTWNMAYAIRHGGLEVYRSTGWLYDTVTGATTIEKRFVLEGSSASAAATAIADAIAIIERDAEQLRKGEPSNGWGSVDGLLNRFLRPLLAMCREHPNATIWCC